MPDLRVEKLAKMNESCSVLVTPVNTLLGNSYFEVPKTLIAANIAKQFNAISVCVCVCVCVC